MFNVISLKHMKKSELISLILLMQNKEIPRMPYEKYGDMHCRLCGFALREYENYCPSCGQMIDWSDCFHD